MIRKIVVWSISGLTCLLVLAGAVSANTYYIKPSGNDGANGLSWSSAWRTIEKVNSTLQGGDTIYFGPGIYRSVIVPPRGASSTDRTAYISGNGVDNTPTVGSAKLYGGHNMSDSAWTVYTGNIYRTSYIPRYTHRGDARAWLVCVDDEMTMPVMSLSELTGPGQSFHDVGTNTLYLWCHDSGNPGTHNIEASATYVMIANSEGQGHHTTFWGFEAKYGSHSLFYWGESAHPDSLFIEHCIMSRCAGPTRQNTACVRVMSGGDFSDSTINGHWNRVRACQISHTLDNANFAQHYKGVSVYQESYFTVDSCIFGEHLGIGVDFKTNMAGPLSVHNVAKYNVFINPDEAGVNIYCHADGDSIYGNVFNGSGNMGVNIMSLQSVGNHTIFNNTFYNCPKAIAVGIEGSTNGANFAKYNIVYSTPGSEQWVMKNNDTLTWTVDSNMYYPASAEDFRTQNASATDLTLAQWQSRYGFDLRSSDTIDPGFADIAGGDFSRPAAEDEINVIYGGRVWTKYGAVQDSMIQAPPPDTTPPRPVDDLHDTLGTVHGSIQLFWTAPGDDDDQGLASRYVIVASTDPLTNSNWNQAEFVFSNPVPPLPAGTPQEYMVTGLDPGEIYYLAIVAFDEYGNSSGLSNTPQHFAAGIAVPGDRFTDLDSANSRITVSCGEVLTYYESLTYQFALDVDRNFSFPQIVDASPQEAAAGISFENLDHETTYFWRCRALAPGVPDSSDWSAYVGFNLIEGLITGGGEVPVMANVKAYPNPAHFDVAPVTFTLPDYPVDLLIQKAASGERVLLETGVSGDYQWNGLNGAGHQVSVGVYAWFVSGGGARANGKIIVKP